MSIKIDPTMLAGLPFELQAEISENLFRKDWTPTEIDAIRRRCEALLKAQAKRNQATAGPHAGRGAKRTGAGKFPEPVKGRVVDKIGAFAGISGRTVQKIAAVVDAAEAEPEKFGHLREELDRHPRGVSRAHRALCRARDDARVVNLRPREGRFRTLVVDPPWPADIDFLGRGMPQYSCMTRDKILALPVASWAEDDCHLYLWATNLNMPLAFECMAAWGFQHKTVLTWIKLAPRSLKPRFGLGAYFRNSTEHVLFGVRGKLSTRSDSIATHFEAPVGGHSEKPDWFYDEIVRKASYLPAGEVFQRKARDGFINLFEPVSTSLAAE